MIRIDPRGVDRTIKAVLGLVLTEGGHVCRVELSCGHTSDLNPTFSHRAGEQCFCRACRDELVSAGVGQVDHT